MPPRRELATLDDLIRIPPFHAWLGIRLVEASPERAVVRVPYRDELIGNPLVPAIHGGVTAGLVDLAGGVVLFASLGIPTPTIDMRIDYMRPALAGRDLIAVAVPKSVGSTIAYVDVEVWQVEAGGAWPPAREESGAERLVATGRCVYSTKDREKPPPAGSGPIG